MCCPLRIATLTGAAPVCTTLCNRGWKFYKKRAAVSVPVLAWWSRERWGVTISISVNVSMYVRMWCSAIGACIQPERCLFGWGGRW